MLLFLDFDGVLHREPYRTASELFRKRPLLENFLRTVPEIEIVISSTWRMTHTHNELRGVFSSDIAPRIIGVTPSWRDIPDILEVVGYQRHAEIEGWRRHNERLFEPWAALDDKPWLYKPFLKNLVVCESAIGITEEVLQQLRSKLQNY